MVGLSPPPECQHHRTPSINLHCMARGRPTSSVALFCYKACAGRRICRLGSPAVAVLQAVFCLPCHLCHVVPLPFSTVCPRSSLLCPVLFILLCPLSIPCAPGSSVCCNSLQAARLSCWQLQHGPAVAARAPVPFDCFFFFLQSP